uniref:Uncharacterized protein n=1 Tax=Candidatus Kentrum sp. FM TaxID=2126340 RepID=A0A450VS28_9GAMM|nr:MAG: hypothetical protein BECKFM1743C_GA0114222_100471 [Candidatus Kentron sp. FM]VFK07579.1 MAG: hypothetical protein BECKFM1743B_GA0114221_100451 [Candidatus Kentron sp. FM]
MNANIVSEAAGQMANLPYVQQEKALKFIEELSLAKGRGAPGERLLKYAGSIAPDDLKIMDEAIQNDCGKIDINEW